MAGDELTDFRLDALEGGFEDHETRMDRCEAKVEKLVDSTSRLVKSQDELSKELRNWTVSTQRRVTALEVRQDYVEKQLGAQKQADISQKPSTELAAPAPGTPAYYLATALRYGGPPVAIAVGILAVVGGTIWVLNQLSII